MTHATHTPGPWTLMYPDNEFDGFVAGPENQTVAIGMGDNTRENARLIAAAPELLAALEKVQDWLEGCSTIKTVRKEVGAAIAKAKGTGNA